MLIVDRDNRHLYELYDLHWNGSQWTAGSGAFFDLNANTRRPDGWTSADAAGLAILPGLVRYDEVFGADEIRHAFRVTVRATNGYVWPASHRAGSNSQALPMGARLRLKASKDLSPYHAGDAEDLPRDAALRPDRRRQRIGHVRQRRVRSALEQRRAQPGVPLADRQRLRRDRARLARRRGGGAVRDAGRASPFSFSQSGGYVVLVWAAAAGAADYVIEVGIGAGSVEPPRHAAGQRDDAERDRAAGPLLRAHPRAQCVRLGAASNEIVVTI